MRPKSFMLLALALGCGLVASIGISQVMERQAKGPAGPEMAMEKIYVALHNINTFDPVAAEDLKLEDWPKLKVPKGAITDIEDIKERRARSTILAGQPLQEEMLTLPGQGETPTKEIPLGYRAYAVRVDAETGTPGLLKPGDRVDVILFVKQRDGIAQTKTQRILFNIRVFAVDQQFRRAAESEDSGPIARTITLVVTPEQADKLALANELGKLRLMPRHPDDASEGDPEEDKGATIADLFSPEKSNRDKEQGDASANGSKLIDLLNGPQTAPAPSAVAADVPPPAPLHKMIVLRGSEATVLEFPTDGGLPTPAGHAQATPAAVEPTPLEPAPPAPAIPAPASDPQPEDAAVSDLIDVLNK